MQMYRDEESESMNSGYLAAKLIRDVLSTRSEESSSLLLTSLERFKVITACFKVKSIMDWDFDFQEFEDIIVKCHLPVEVLWNLHFSQVLPLETYLLRVLSKTDPSNEEALHRICDFCLADSKQDIGAIFAQTGLLIFLVNKAFYIADEKTKQISLKILDLVLEGIFSEEKDNITQELMKPFFNLWSCQMIEESTLKAFCSFTLQYYIKLSHSTVLETFSTQEFSKNKNESPHIVICKLISTLECEKVQELMFSLASEKKISWTNYLRVIDSYAVVQTSLQVSVVISQLINQLLKQAFQNQISSSMQKAILIGRQMALLSESSFPLAYKQWFQAQFTDCIPLKNPQTFSFFIQVLSGLIPYEKNISLIKVALEPLLRVPSECQHEYADYIALLKTRVKDLEPQMQPEEILNKLLLTFQQNGKIPPYVLEASLMRKHYFLNEFLPVLLVPRVVPSIPDVREKFVLELNRAGKIPVSILQKYRTACLEEEQKLLGGLDLNEHFVEDL